MVSHEQPGCQIVQDVLHPILQSKDDITPQSEKGSIIHKESAGESRSSVVLSIQKALPGTTTIALTAESKLHAFEAEATVKPKKPGGSRVIISRVTIIITHIMGLLTPLVTTHEALPGFQALRF